jgi:hypothetical protein
MTQQVFEVELVGCDSFDFNALGEGVPGGVQHLKHIFVVQGPPLRRGE